MKKEEIKNINLNKLEKGLDLWGVGVVTKIDGTHIYAVQSYSLGGKKETYELNHCVVEDNKLFFIEGDFITETSYNSHLEGITSKK